MVAPMSRQTPAAAPLGAREVRIHAVQFVGTNVEMTYTVEPGSADPHAGLEALLSKNLGLHALTPTGELEGRARFSVIASPLERLFHKIGPAEPLTMIKHASTTLDLSEVQLDRLAQGLAESVREATEPAERRSGTLPFWDAGKFVAVLLRRPAYLEAGPVTVAGVALEPESFPDAALPELPKHVAEHGGVRLELPQELLARFAPHT